jgi:hypothetical protein
MIYQLSNGRIIEMSTEQYLELSDEDIFELIGLSPIYSMEVANPFFKPFSNKYKYEDPELTHEVEPDLTDVDPEEKRDDSYYHSDDN